jgi:eIF-2B alpha/beta/delta-like uncharacterized protein
MNEGVMCTLAHDNTPADLMSRGVLDLVIVGSDRIAANGDVANKIGTLDRAILAKHFDVPFYVAAPTTTIDFGCSGGNEIPIEQRSEDEVLYMTGPTKDGRMEKILTAAPDSSAVNPAFDVTPANLIDGIITEKGIVEPNKLSTLF